MVGCNGASYCTAHPVVNYISVINNELKPPSGFSTAEDVDAAMQALSLGEITITNNIAIKSAMQLAFWSVLNGGGPFGTVIVKSGNLVSYGANHVVRHSDPTDHGEVNALRRAISNSKGQDLDGATLFTSTYPCPMCCGLAIDSGIKTIVYCNTEADAEHHGGFNDQVFWQEVKKIPQADVASSLLYGIDGNTIVQSNDGQSLDTVLRDYCKRYGFEPEGLQFDACCDGHALTLYEYTALRWAGVTVPASVQIQSFKVPELIQDDVFQRVGQHIFSLFKHQGASYGQLS